MNGNSRFGASKKFTTILSVMTVCLGLVAVPKTYAAGVWTNEPAGSSVVKDCSFSGSPSACGILDVYSSSIQDSDSTASISPPGVMRSTIYPGNTSGGSQLNWVTPQVNDQMYVGLMWRNNPQFGCRTTANKMWFMKGPAVNGFFGLGCKPGDSSGTIYFGHNTATLDNSHTCAADLGLICNPNVGSVSIKHGTWTKLEAYIKKSTTATSRDGVLRWWVNGVLVGNYNNLNYAGNGLNEWVWTETWDGTVSNPIPSVEWSHYIDHLHISIPGGNTSTDQPPGPPASPTMRSVTTP